MFIYETAIRTRNRGPARGGAFRRAGARLDKSFIILYNFAFTIPRHPGRWQQRASASKAAAGSRIRLEGRGWLSHPPRRPRLAQAVRV